jgi:hypothetical protein
MVTIKALLGSALVTLGVAAGSLLAPQAASALDFTFSFDASFGGVTGSDLSVTGLIRGLVDGQTIAPKTITVTNTSDPINGIGTYSFGSGEGFTLEGGVITVSQWRGSLDANYALSFFMIDGEPLAALREFDLLILGQPTFSPASPAGVPGPLPIFGAAAAYGYSRRLRKRINGSNNTFSTTTLA